MAGKRVAPNQRAAQVTQQKKANPTQNNNTKTRANAPKTNNTTQKTNTTTKPSTPAASNQQAAQAKAQDKAVAQKKPNGTGGTSQVARGTTTTTGSGTSNKSGGSGSGGGGGSSSSTSAKSNGSKSSKSTTKTNAFADIPKAGNTSKFDVTPSYQATAKSSSAQARAAIDDARAVINKKPEGTAAQQMQKTNSITQAQQLAMASKYKKYSSLSAKERVESGQNRVANNEALANLAKQYAGMTGTPTNTFVMYPGPAKTGNGGVKDPAPDPDDPDTGRKTGAPSNTGGGSGSSTRLSVPTPSLPAMYDGNGDWIGNGNGGILDTPYNEAPWTPDWAINYPGRTEEYTKALEQAQSDWRSSLSDWADMLGSSLAGQQYDMLAALRANRESGWTTGAHISAENAGQLQAAQTLADAYGTAAQPLTEANLKYLQSLADYRRDIPSQVNNDIHAWADSYMNAAATERGYSRQQAVAQSMANAFQQWLYQTYAPR